jgi:hypothetical protein
MGTGLSVDERINMIQNTGSSSAYSGLIKNIQTGLAEIGLTLHKNDVAKLTGTVKKIEQYELQLARLCAVLQSIVKLARFWGIGLDNVDKDRKRTLDLSQVSSLDDLREVIRGYAREVQRSMVSHMNISQAAAYDLVSSAVPRVIDSAIGATESAKDSVYRRAISGPGSSSGDKQYMDIL